MTLSETIKAGPTAGRLDHIPGHMGMPIFGSTFEFLRDPFAFHQSRREKYGLVYKFSAFGGETVVLHGAETSMLARRYPEDSRANLKAALDRELDPTEAAAVAAFIASHGLEPAFG